MPDEEKDIGFKIVGIMEMNPYKVLIRFRESNLRLMMDKKEFSELISGVRSSIEIARPDPRIVTLTGEPAAVYAGRAELTRNKRGIRMIVSTDYGGRRYFMPVSKAEHVLFRRHESCPVSEMWHNGE